ncbi:MAG TPA: hypothetical protein DC015_05540 [Aequorivita sp.]|jgi:hypothetical protein|nr:hypothetical protein [Aequorivita sp.]HBC03653.1 hypothetical protein [Aequorivita sp.]|tara:strand:- start:17110 stop:17658 length:549 start_codon:yes stop_codon:yes gene_type:complete
MNKPEHRHDEKRDIFIGKYDQYDVYFRGFHSNKKDRHLNGFIYRNFSSGNDYEQEEYDDRGHLSRPIDRFTKYSDVSTKNVKKHYFKNDVPIWLSEAKIKAIAEGIILNSRINTFRENGFYNEDYNIIQQFEILEEDKKLYNRIKISNLILNASTYTLVAIFFLGSGALFFLIVVSTIEWII